MERIANSKIIEIIVPAYSIHNDVFKNFLIITALLIGKIRNNAALCFDSAPL